MLTPSGVADFSWQLSRRQSLILMLQTEINLRIRQLWSAAVTHYTTPVIARCIICATFREESCSL